MVLRTCQHCGRKFTKTEHFKRHQRSHTKERPYECSICHKSFSRSDVLYRHTKLHEGQEPDPNAVPIDTPSAPVMVSTQHPNPRTGHDQMNTYQPTPQTVQGDLHDQIHPSLRNMSTPNLANGLGSIQSSVSAPSPGSVGQQALHRHSITSFNGYVPNMVQPDHSHHVEGVIPPANHMNSTPMVPMAAQTPQAPSHDTQSFASPYPDQFDTSANDALQFWLNQADNDIDFSNLQMPDLNGPFHHSNPGSTFATSPPSVGSSHAASISSIPEARFAKVEHVWRAKLAKSSYFQNLWNEVATSSARNIFCCDGKMARLASPSGYTDSRWGINAAIRNQLKVEFGTPSPTPNGQRGPQNFPPAEVLDIALDIYFRRIHPKSPFIHVPTFQASLTPPALLFIMCILGLSTMSTGVSKFVKKAFLDVRKRALLDLVASDTDDNSSEEHLCAFAASFLTLQLAVFSSDIDLVAQTQVLYSTLMAVSTRQGLFNAPEASYSDILPGPDQLNQRWCAWARVESVRRLIICLLSTDWWWGNNASLNPLIHPEDVQVSLPSDDDLFNARTAEDWMHLIHAGRNFEMPSVRPRGLYLKGSLDALLMQPHPIQPFTMHSLLTVIKHLLCDIQHRYFAQVEDWRGSDRLVPWKTYRLDFRGCAFVPTVVQLARAAITSQRYSELNVVVLWHNLNINLTANVGIFEMAAGKKGADKGLRALADIAEWSKTPAARRAAIHAAQTYRHLSNRKVSDTLMLNCFSSLFVAALVLGLFVFQVQQDQSSGNGPGLVPFDLMGDIDWTLVGDCGLTDPVTKPVSMYDAHQRTAVTDYINFGGPVLLNGIPTTGYMSARRVLHDFAHLMDEMGPWKPKTFSRILHIMSDVLEDTP
ncbi:hypothetical protein K461DRAFT_24387 [Myriangium duriaei CBS 260.36]|uniref:C2H2-type domain-containing protein n=1 Tax=Myriangium duriaei CBS 260.36 TaxID=1168546 RepID=A0A9P4JBX2_9PEZI|nr:hypothetical protein K461DRAFT_24387 [Myriangium duriaei CBS 260.36]